MKPASPFTQFVRSPRVQLWAAVIVAVGVWIARKPWALVTPQLYAEDGTIHLNHVEEFGAGAFLVPYRGYLHTLPTLVAWIAQQTADVAHWPGIYNWACLFITALLFARIASPRIELPGKPWLVLAIALVAQSGEVVLNLTNVHWLTGFFLVLQAIIARPQTIAQRAGDFVLVALVGLSDPSSIIFLPLFVWRWWRARHDDNLTLLLLIGACAGVQAYFLKTAGLNSGAPTPPLHLLALLQRASARLVLWPFFGSSVVTLLPVMAQAVIGVTFIGALTLWAGRPHPLRAVRLHLIAAWVLISIACVYRIRPDTWDQPFDNLGYAEPYFFMSRVLLVWLMICEFNTQPRVVGGLARVMCVVGAALALPDLRVPAPPDYHWAQSCEPIRRGVPANIPTLPGGWTLEYHGRPPSRR